MTGAPLLYDAHELETEVVGTSATERRLSRWAERFLIRWVDQTITVCDSIADWYVDTSSIEQPFVVRNIPDWDSDVRIGSDVLREIHRIPESDLIFLYQGALSPGRGIERLLEVFDEQESDKHLMFVGYGVLESQILERAARSNNVHFQQAVPPDEVVLYTSSADIGLCLIEDVCLSNYYSLPNKLFEYLLSGLPIIVNDMPEQRVIIEKYCCGWIAPKSESDLVSLIRSIDRACVEDKFGGVLAASQDFSWKAEAEIMKDAYLAIERGRVPHGISNKPQKS
jgi:glycosyltransferase involved in cell wall biosynthesis